MKERSPGYIKMNENQSIPIYAYLFAMCNQFTGCMSGWMGQIKDFFWNVNKESLLKK